MFAFHLIQCIIATSVSLLVGSVAFIPVAPKTLSSKKPGTHFSIPSPSSSSLVVVIQKVSPATSNTALNLEPISFSLDVGNLMVGLAALLGHFWSTSKGVSIHKWPQTKRIWINNSRVWTNNLRLWTNDSTASKLTFASSKDWTNCSSFFPSPLQCCIGSLPVWQPVNKRHRYSRDLWRDFVIK